ncbi:MAG: SHOCT domain-containing protein [Chloroflexi bacterium]|nr:SHOCT domain-containing protein [Chloroflexota bacterium]
MMRRPPPRRGPGLMGTMARTAVVAGTAAVTVNAVQGAGQKKAMAQQAAAQQAADVQALQQQVAQMEAQQAAAAVAAAAPPPAPAPAVAPAPAGGPDLMTQLTQLAEMKANGILSDEQFEAAKAKLLGA